MSWLKTHFAGNWPSFDDPHWMRNSATWQTMPTSREGSEQRGSRPVVVISRDAINESSPVVSAAPYTTYREGRRIYPSQVLVKAPEGGLEVDSMILGEQVRVLDKKRLLRRRGELTRILVSSATLI